MKQRNMYVFMVQLSKRQDLLGDDGMRRVLYVIIPIIVIFSLICVSNADTLGTPSYVNAFVYNSSSIRVTWDNSVQGAARYTIQRQTDSGNFVTIATVPSNVSSYTDTNISNGHTYVYRVFATKGGDAGRPRDSFPVEFLYPTGLTVKGLSDSEVELNWTYPVSNKIPDTNYQTVIERRSEGSNTWQTIATVPGNQDSYIDTGLSEASRYYYRIRAVTSVSAIYLYHPSSGSGQYVSTMLKAPQNVKAEILSTSSVKISWDDVSTKESGYRIERKKGNGVFVRIGSTLANETSFIDKSAENGQQYTYRVVPLSNSFRGKESEEVTVPFLFPVSFDIKEVYSTQVILSWEYPGESYISPDNSVVLIERREGGSNKWEEIHTTRPGETEYTDNNLTPGTRYYYRIRSRYDGGFTTEYFPSATGVAAVTKLTFETHFYGHAISTTEILLEWNKDAAGSNKIILEKLDSNGVFVPLATLTNTGSYIDTVSPGTINGYRMKLRSSTNVESDYTPEIYISTEQLPRVQNFEITSIVPNRVFLTWEYDKAVETGFEIWRMTGSEGIWKHIGTTRSGQYMYSDENITNGETYTYQIRAIKNITIFSDFTAVGPVKISFKKHEGSLVVSLIDGMLYLGWDDFSDMEKYYIIEYKTSINDIWKTYEKLPKDTTMFRFVPTDGVDYTLRIRAYSEDPIFEAFSNEVFYTTKIPATPSLSIPTVVGSNRVVLTWNDLSDNEDEFTIYRKSDIYDNDYKLIGVARHNATVFSDTNVEPNHSYSYIVKSKNAAGESFPSNEIHVTTPPLTVYGDIPSHLSWAGEAINALTAMGIVNGDGKGNFNPSGNITRAEFVKMLVTTFALPETPIGSFKDVTPDDWHHRYIMTAYRYKIIEPDKDGMFYPNMPITRQDIVYYSSRAIKTAGHTLEQPPLYTLFKFTDYSEIDPYAQSAFAQMYFTGIINGIGNNKLGPKYTATRAEAATIIYRIIKVLEK